MITEIVQSSLRKKTFATLIKFGGPGLVVLGIIDSSAIPTFGGLDLLLIFMAAAHSQLWWYYGLMALIGSMIGAWLTYRIARKGGKEALDKRFPKDKIRRVYDAYEKYGFWAVFIPAILPPPFPTSPFLVSAGAMKYDLKKYLVTLLAARTVRYAIFAWIGAHYGRGLIHVFRQNQHWLVIVCTVLAILAGAVIAFFMWRTHQKRKSGSEPVKQAA